MFVKKFEADTLEEALKAVKVELGPDAIILKTITNNGLKGAFKKKKIEITAAISEKNYVKKAKVDKVLNDEQKEVFYQKPAASIKESIQRYSNAKTPPPQDASGYGSMGLNKVVNTIAKGTASLADVTSKTSNLIMNSLDDFLTDEDSTADTDTDSRDQRRAPEARGKYAEPPAPRREVRTVERSAPERVTPEAPAAPATSMVSREAYNELRQELRTQQHKLDLLEKKLAEMAETLQHGHRNQSEAQGVYQLRTTLKTLDIDDSHILDIIKKANYELSRDDLENPDVIFEFALREMAGSIHTAVPLFATADGGEPVITALISEAASGQSTMGSKIAVLKKDVVLVQFSHEAQSSNSSDFAAQVFGIRVEKAQSFSEAIGICRKTLEGGKSVLLDLRLNSRYVDETKKFVESLKRGFNRVEVLCTLSAIHSELYNRKILARYKDTVDGVIISHVDLCMNFGSLFNVHKAHNKLPLKFFGTGPVVPDDIEGATAERLMAGLFQF